jgi:hypothetical protein
MVTNAKKKTAGKYAAHTKIAPEQTLMEIQRLVKKYGATGFGFMESNGTVGILFEMKGRRIRLLLPLPLPPTEQEVRQRWRALLLIVKAKLEAIDLMATTFEQEFMFNFVLPDTSTVGDKLLPQIEAILKDGKLPPMLGSGS